MNTEEEILDAVIRGGSTDLAAVVCWLTLSPLNWCIVGGAAVNSYTETALYDDRLDVAASGEPGFSLLSDLTAEGFTVQVDARAQLVRLTRPGSGHRMRITIRYGEQFQQMPARAERRSILGQCLPVAALADVTTALRTMRGDEGAGWHERGKAELDLVRLTEHDQERVLAHADAGDGWG